MILAMAAKFKELSFKIKKLSKDCHFMAIGGCLSFRVSEATRNPMNLKRFLHRPFTPHVEMTLVCDKKSLDFSIDALYLLLK